MSRLLGTGDGGRGLPVHPVGMVRSPTPLPAGLGHAVFTTREARGHGVSPDRLRAGDLVSLGRGLWALRSREVTEAEIVAAHCRVHPAAFAAGITAAHLWDFPLPGALGDKVVTAPVRSARADGQLVQTSEVGTVDRRIHLATTAWRPLGTDLIRWSGSSLSRDQLSALVPLKQVAIDQVVPLTSRIRTLLDLGSVLQPEALTVIGDHLVRRPRPRFEGRTQPFATIEQLQTAAEEHTGRGVRAVRAAMKMVRMSSDSPAETRLRLAFLRAGLPEPVANSRLRVAVAPGDGLIDLGEPDLQWPQWRVVLEHEGPSHLRPEQLARDIERTERRRDAGWLEVRTTARDLRHECRSAIVRTRAALASRGWRG